MRDHELELIAGLVEGRLDDETEARALIASSPEHAAEYEAQKLAYDALRGSGRVAMSETERAQLRRDLWTALRSEPAAKSKSPWWYRWTPVAAGLLVVAGSVAVLNQSLGGDEAMETFAEIGSSLDSGGGAESATTTAAASEGETRDADSDAGADGATETTAATEEQPEAAPSEPADTYSVKAADVRQGNYEDAGALPYAADDPVDPDLKACVTQAVQDAGLDGYELHAILEGLEEGSDENQVEGTSTTLSEATAELAVVTPEPADLSVAPLAFVDLADCVVVYLDE